MPDRGSNRLCGLPVHGAGGRRLAADRLHRTLDRAPESGDLGRRAAFSVVFTHAFAVAERHQQVGAIADLAAPYWRPELRQRLAGDADDAAFDAVAQRRRAVDDDRIGLATGAAGLNRLLHRIDVE